MHRLYETWEKGRKDTRYKPTYKRERMNIAAIWP